MKNLVFIVAIIFGFIIGSCQKKETQVLISTNHGDIKAVLFDETPIHKDNFITLAKKGFYDGLLFHRIIDGFMIQGGDPDSKNAPIEKNLGAGGPGYTLEAEIGAPHLRGTLAAARNNNPEKRSSGSQFYITIGSPVSDAELSKFETSKGITYNETQRKLYTTEGGAPFLDKEYTVFGKVIEGMEVVDKIGKLPKMPNDRPNENVTMTVKILN